MTSTETTLAMDHLAAAMVAFHKADLESGDAVRKAAVIVKATALLVLAFDAPAARDGMVDHAQALRNLSTALVIIQEGRRDEG